MIYTNRIPLQRTEKCGILTKMKPVLQHRPANKSGMQCRKVGERESGFLELEQAKQRVEELRTIIEKIIVFIMIRMRRNWKILSMMP